MRSPNALARIRSIEGDAALVARALAFGADRRELCADARRRIPNNPLVSSPPDNRIDNLDVFTDKISAITRLVAFARCCEKVERVDRLRST